MDGIQPRETQPKTQSLTQQARTVDACTWQGNEGARHVRERLQAPYQEMNRPKNQVAHGSRAEVVHSKRETYTPSGQTALAPMRQSGNPTRGSSPRLGNRQRVDGHSSSGGHAKASGQWLTAGRRPAVRTQPHPSCRPAAHPFPQPSMARPWPSKPHDLARHCRPVPLWSAGCLRSGHMNTTCPPNNYIHT